MDYTHQIDSDESHLGRRSFLSRSMAMGIVAGLGTGATRQEDMVFATLPDAECKPSPADSLLLYLDLLIKVQSNAFYDASKGIIIASKNCSDTLKKIQDQVKVLQTEVQNAHTKAQTQQMRQALDFGRAQAQLIKTSLNAPQDGQRLVASALVLVSDHISQAAQDLLPAGEITLSAKAKDALAELIRLVRDFEQVPEETRRAQEEYQDRVNEIRTTIDQIRNDLFAASAKANDAETADSESAAQEARNSAASTLDQAICKLKNFGSKPADKLPCDTPTPEPIPPSGVAKTPPALPAAPSVATPIDLMIAVLEGTKRIIQNPQLISRIIRGGEDNPRFIQASFGGSHGAPLSIYSRVQAAINRECPKGTPLRTFWCIDLILGPLAYPDKQTRIPLIAGVLLLFPCWVGNKTNLAAALAEI